MKVNKKNKQTENIRTNKSRSKLYLLFLIIVPLVLYFRILNFNFTNFDDSDLISNNYNIIGNIENVPKAFTTDAYFSHQSNFYRPLQNVSFMIDAQISGKDPWAYHLTNLFLFILICITLFVLLSKLGLRQEIAFLLSLIFSVHPLLTGAVCWIPAQGDLLITLFGMMSFISFIKYYDKKKLLFLVFHSIFILLAFFAKETALIFPVLLSVYFYLFLKKERSLKEMFPFMIIWCSSFLMYFCLRSVAITGNESSSFSGITVFIKNLPVIPITFGKIFLPLGLTTMPLFNNLAVIIGIIIFIISVAIIIRYRIYNNVCLILGVLWFAGFTLPPLYFRLTIAEFSAEYFEHRTLLPIIGIFMMLGAFLSSLPPKWTSANLIKLFIPVLLIYAFVAYTHSKDYSDPIAFFSAAIGSNPNNAAALNCRGSEYLHNGDIQQSLIDYDSAIKAFPVYSSPYFNEGNIYLSSGDENKALYYFSQALKYDTLYPKINIFMADNAYINLSAVMMNLKRFDEAVVILRKALIESPSNSSLYNNLGFAYFSKAGYDSANYAFSKAIRLQPDNSSYYTNRGLSSFVLKNYKSALSDYTRVLAIDPGSAGSWFNSGKTKIELNDFEGAISDLSAAIRINPKWSEAFYQRGLSYSKLNKLDEAGKDWAEAKKLASKEFLLGK